MEIIRQYAPNSDEVVKLKLACYELAQHTKKGTRYSVEDTYFDFGQGWKWTTIIAHRPDGCEWQALTPRDYEDILLSTDIPATVADIVTNRYFYD